LTLAASEAASGEVEHASKETRHKKVWLQHLALIEDDEVLSASLLQQSKCDSIN